MVPAPRSEKIIPSEENWRPFRYCLTVTHCIQNSFEAKKLWGGFFNVLSTLFLCKYTRRVSQYEWVMSKWYDWWLPDRTLKIVYRRLGAASKLKPHHLNWARSPLNMNGENQRNNHDMKDDVMWCDFRAGDGNQNWAARMQQLRQPGHSQLGAGSQSGKQGAATR